MKRGLYIVVLSSLMTGCVPIPVSKKGYQDDKIEVSHRGIRYWPWPAMVAERSVAKVYGRSYSNVRGADPYYLEIPGRRTLLFVTGPEGSALVHIVDEATHAATHFPAYDSDIGNQIGGRTSGLWEKIESVNGDTLVISSAVNWSVFWGSNFNYRHFIDLKQPKYLRQELDYFSGMDGKRVHRVDEGGRRSAPE